jgi:AcrR family transcriptional regulator
MNNPLAAVLKRSSPAARGDRRVLRTKHALGAALTELMLEQPFDAITVQNVLDRAGVGRATFYSHFRNKRDLFHSEHERFFEGVESWLGTTSAHTHRVAPVTEFFQHVGEVQPFIRALREAGQIDLVWEDAAEHFARMIAKRLVLLSPPLNGSAVQTTVIAKFCAGALMELLKWWLDRDVRPTPREMDAMYHDLVWRALGVPTTAPPLQTHCEPPRPHGPPTP